MLTRLLWYFWQLFPCTYRTRYWDADHRLHFSVWKMWLGRCYEIDDVVVCYDAVKERRCIAAVERAVEQPEEWDDEDEEGDRREPQNYGEIAYSGIAEGEVDGMWLLSYGMPGDDVTINVAVFDTHEAALDMAAQIDALTGANHIWRVDTVFLNPPDASELVAVFEGTVEEHEA